MEKNIMIFDGEYKYGKKYKGKEYNEDGKLIFEGVIKDGMEKEKNTHIWMIN